MALLTSRTLATGVTGTDLIHIVITGDTSQNPAGSSYKAEIDQVKNYLSNYFISSTGNTSASCITDLYVTNVYGCSPITIHDSIQSVGSSSTGITSFAFGASVASFGDYSHAEGDTTTSLGTGSHAEGYNTHTGLFGYNSTSIVSGVITLDSSYGDVTSQFGSFIILDDYNFDGYYGVVVFNINSITFDGTNTIITLSDLSVNTTQAHIGSDLFNPANSNVYVGGYYSHSEGTGSSSVGVGTHSEGETNLSVGYSSHSEGQDTKSFGDGSHSEGIRTTSIGGYSHAEGGNTIASGNYSHSEGINTQTNSEGSHSEGSGTTSNANASHAEGLTTSSDGFGSHSEGISTISTGLASHSEGNSSQSIGDYSHSEGCSTYTGQYGYLGTMIKTGRDNVILLDAMYGDVSSQFSNNLILNDSNFSNTYGTILSSILSVSVTFTPQTQITLQDQTIFTPTAIFGVFGVANPLNADYPIGGSCSHSEGNGSMAVGGSSHSQGLDTISFGEASFASGVQSHAIGTHSFIHSNNSQVYGNRSVVLGGQNITGTTDDTVYVPYLNIGNLATGTSVNNLGIDSQGNVVVGGGSSSLTPPVTISGVGMTVLTLIGSGTTVPVFSVQGSSGELFSVTDSLTGSLFSVNDISGLPVLEAFSDSTILMGDYLSPSLNTTKKVTASSGTSTTIYSIPVSAYTGAFFDYTVGSGTNFRSGNITVIWDGSTAQYTDTYSGGTSPEIGLTSDITFSVSISVGGTADLVATTVSNSWDVKVIVRSI